MKTLLFILIVLLMSTSVQAATHGRTTITASNPLNIEDSFVALINDNAFGVSGQQATSISLFCAATSVAKNALCGLYDMSDNSLIAETNEESVSTSAGSWHTFDFASPVALDSGIAYGIACQADAAAGEFYVTYDYWDADWNSYIKFSVTYDGSMEDPIPAAGIPAAGDACVHFTYEAAPSSRRIISVH